LDAILNSASGKLPWKDAISAREKIVVPGLSTAAARRKLVLSAAAASLALDHLVGEGWVRQLSPALSRYAVAGSGLSKRELAAAREDDADEESGQALGAGGEPRFFALGERTYAELKKYIEERMEGRENCALCHKMCVMVRLSQPPLYTVSFRLFLNLQHPSC